MGVILSHEQVIEAVCAEHSLGCMDYEPKGPESLDVSGKSSINCSQKYLYTLTSMGSGMKLIRSNGAQKEANS